MSYIQVDIGGRKRGIKFSQGTNILLQDRVIIMDDDERKAFGVPVIVWAGLKTNCVIKGERFTKTADNPEKITDDTKPDTVEVPATFEDVCDWCETLPDSIKVDIVNLFSEINPQSGNVEDEKKNQPVITDTAQNVTDSPAES